MPMLYPYLPEGGPSPSAERELLARITDLLIEYEGVGPARRGFTGNFCMGASALESARVLARRGLDDVYPVHLGTPTRRSEPPGRPEARGHRDRHHDPERTSRQTP